MVFCAFAALIDETSKVFRKPERVDPGSFRSIFCMFPVIKKNTNIFKTATCAFPVSFYNYRKKVANKKDLKKGGKDMRQELIAGSLLALIGLLLFVKPLLIWELTEKWKSKEKTVPSDTYYLVMKFVGAIAFLVGTLLVTGIIG